MLENINAAYLQLLTLVSFFMAVVAAVLAVDMYRLLRTAEVGNSWRILCIASVLFALTLALRLAEFFDWGGLKSYELSRFGEAMFVFALAYSFHLQRKAFSHAKELRDEPAASTTEPEPEPDLDTLGDLATFYAEGAGSIGAQHNR